MTHAIPTLRTAVVVLGAAAAAAVGATAAPAAPSAKALAAAPAASVDRCRPPAKFGNANGERATIFRDYCEICRDTGWREIKKTYLLKGTTPARIALQYASSDHFGSVLPPAKQGCERGFALRGRP